MIKGIVLPLVFTASSVFAQPNMAPLDTVLSSQPEDSYQYVRCAAFYLSNIEWAGQALSEETFEQSSRAIEDLLLIAAVVRSVESTDSIEHISSVVNLDTRQIADFYLEDYRTNYALTGTAWDGNVIWESDAATCQPIAQAANVIAAEFRGG